VKKPGSVTRHRAFKFLLPRQKTPSTIAATKAKATYAATTLNLFAMVMARLPDEFAAHITPHKLTSETPEKSQRHCPWRICGARNVVKDA
jgi:hypothetical protein